MGKNYPSLIESPIDLSRRCDSVETRKTPSPYSSTGSGATPPSSMNDSPTSSHTASNLLKRQHSSDSPTHSYDSDYLHSQFPIPQTNANYEFKTKAEMHVDEYMQHRLMQNENNIPPYPLDIEPIRQMEIQRKFLEMPSTLGLELALKHGVQHSDGNSSTNKVARPFKAYQENAFLSDLIVDENYKVFRDQTLAAIRMQNGGQLTVSNPRMRRFRTKSPVSQQMSSDSAANDDGGQTKDSAYYERRRKNNEAAKKSRDRRRQKEDELAVRTRYLEQENMFLRVQLAAIKKQLAHMYEAQKK